MMLRLILLIFVSPYISAAFTVSQRANRPTHRTSQYFQYNQISMRLYEKLNFRCSRTFHTKTLPMDSLETLRNLFDESFEDLAKIALGGSGVDNVVIIPMTESMMENWTNAAKNVHASQPTKHGFICKVNTGGFNFSGLKVTSIANIGAQLVRNDDVTQTCLEFTYIDDEQIVEGPRFLVNIFNALTAADSKNVDEDEKRGQSVQSLSRLYVTVSNETVVFHVDTSLDISITFASILLKILPVSKEKAEEQGSQAVMKTLVKDTEAMIQKLESFYKVLLN